METCAKLQEVEIRNISDRERNWNYGSFRKMLLQHRDYLVRLTIEDFVSNDNQLIRLSDFSGLQYLSLAASNIFNISLSAELACKLIFKAPRLTNFVLNFDKGEDPEGSELSDDSDESIQLFTSEHIKWLLQVGKIVHSNNYALGHILLHFDAIDYYDAIQDYGGAMLDILERTQDHMHRRNIRLEWDY